MWTFPRHSARLARGKNVAAVLAGSWREQPPPLAVAPEALPEVVPLLLASGAASLAFRRLGSCGARHADAVDSLREAQAFYVLLSRVLEQQVAATVLVLRGAGVDPLLGKGWLAARAYPDPALRPYRDIDLCVRPAELARARAALDDCASLYPVELKVGLPDLPDRPIDDLYARSRTVEVAGAAVRTLGPEDHFRYLCVHMLRHGVSRPLWLVDIAVLLESPTPGFDWDLCLRGDARRSGWVITAVQLAAELLQCRPSLQPATGAAPPPAWLVPAVLRQWGSPGSGGHPADAGIVEALRSRWPDPVRATVRLNRSFDESSRLPLQTAEYLRMLGTGAWHAVAGSSASRTARPES